MPIPYRYHTSLGIGLALRLYRVSIGLVLTGTILVFDLYRLGIGLVQDRRWLGMAWVLVCYWIAILLVLE